jgi:bacillithiol system protein YtxJ
MNWIQLDSEEKISEIKSLSNEKRVMIFKFSPRFPISILMRGLLEREWSESEMEMKAYFLDTSEHPALSKKIESEFNISHQSPQVLIIEEGKCVFSAANGGVDFRKIREFSNLRKIKV